MSPLTRSHARTFLATALSAATLSAGLAACGDDSASAPLAVESVRTAEQDTPPPALALGLLGSTADVAPAHTRLSYVNPKALATLGASMPADEISELVLGKIGAGRVERAADPAPQTVLQIGPATVFTSGSQRTVAGGRPTLRDQLEDPAPAVSLITPETPSAVQSCLGDPAAEVIVGPAVLGRMSSIGVGVVSTGDAPAGPKLLICAAPHFARDLHRTEVRLSAKFPSAGVAADRAPVVAEQEIGERDIVGAAVALDQVDPALLRKLLAGGPALLELARG